ncbi:LysR family transcriptional regulator [Erwinia persicina]|uniref:LysR family transcriptional regulator n=1 Tax=Erwinia persicina TaxID=55211 RepID=UPI000E8FE735|nr:LysR family transcriptional regulator [Erwinia persicina]MCQ4103945.1 LysR family transcriptional regulator [Erwinia persicina]UTX11153.1 LysR family transcriptional regulator [Erwinia persicina]HBT12502.1 transcriptional regulator [Erwinia persicina]HBT30172.1 transcriptional regulator [Erwinia persicina]
MDRLDEMAVFVAIVQQGSLTAAARVLRRSPPAITRALTALEHRLGVMLVERTTRRLSPTAAGLALFERAKSLLEDYQQVMLTTTRNTLSGKVCLTAPVQFGRQHIAPLVMTFLERYPDIEIELLLSDSYQDLIEQGLDMAVRIGQLRDSSLVATEVGQVYRMLVASPAYLMRHGHPQRPAMLTQHHLIAGNTPSVQREWRFGSDSQQERVRITPRLSVNEVETQLMTARAGQGIARLLSYQVYEDLRRGTLCEVLTDYRPPPVPVQLVAQNVKYMPAKVRAFWDLARATLPELESLREQTLRPVK